MRKENALEPALGSNSEQSQEERPALEGAEPRGRGLAIAIIAGLFAIPFYLEWLQIGPSDVAMASTGPAAVELALMPVGISLVGWLRMALWSGLLGLVYRGRRWARITVAVIATLRGAVAFSYAAGAAFQNTLALLFALFGVAYLVAALLLFGAPALVPYLARQPARA